MKSPFFRFSGRSCLFVTVFLTSGTSAFAQTTGWIRTAAGTYDYSDTANWVDSDGNPGATVGDINGIWDPTLTLTGSQTATFGTDTTLTTGLNIGYVGNVDLTLSSDGTADRTLTLGGDILVAMAGNRTFNIGSSAANSALNLDLGGDRTFTVAAGKNINVFNTISGGDLLITGTAPNAAGGTFKFYRSIGNAAGVNVTVGNNATIQFDNSVNGNAGATRAASLTLISGGKLSVRGNSTNTIETITGAFTTDGGGRRPKYSGNSMQSVTLDAGGGNTLLSVGSLARLNHGTLLVRGDNLGVNTIASATVGSSNLRITGTAPTLVGGNGAGGPTTLSIVPWMVGGSTIADIGSTFVTYTAANGLRPLDTATEFAAAIGGNAADNVRLIATTSVDSSTTVNSLIFGSASVDLTGSSTLTVTSGAVFVTGAGTDINANLNFGTAEGILGYNRGFIVNGTIAGSGGLTVHGNRNDELVQLKNGSSTYTGDTVILANAMVATGFLPSGGRTGDVYVYGNLQLDTASYHGTINGLFGTGDLKYENSGDSSLSVGDNDATSTFSGSILTNNKLAFTKIGGGTLTLDGENQIAGTTTVSDGTLVVNGSLGNTTTTIESGGTLKGSGTIGGTVGVNGTLAPGNSIGTLNFLQTLTLTGTSDFEIDPTLSLGLNSDLANVTGDISYGGILNVLYTGSVTNFSSGMVFNLFDASAFTGSFSEVNLPDLTGTGLSWQNDLATTGTLTVIPEPRAAFLGCLGMFVLLRRRRR